MIVHINPSTMEGLPSTMSVELMLTSFIWGKTHGRKTQKTCKKISSNQAAITTMRLTCTSLCNLGDLDCKGHTEYVI